MAIERTFGDGGDHATLAAAWTWLLTQDPLADNYIFTQISDTIETTWTIANLVTNGFTVMFTTDTPNGGDPTKGWKVQLTNGVTQFYRIESSVGRIIIDGLYFKRTAGATDLFMQLSPNNQLPSTSTATVRNCLFEGSSNNAFDDDEAFDIGRDRDIVYFYNNKIWNMNKGLTIEINTGSAGEKTQDKVFENITIYNCYNGVEFINNSFTYHIRMRNIVSSGCVNQDWLYSTGIRTHWALYNCSDSDGTLASLGIPINENQLLNIVPADNFESLLDTNDKFLFLNPGTKQLIVTASPKKGTAPLTVQFTSEVKYVSGGGVLHDGGMAPTLVSQDIAGVDIPDDVGDYPIGAHAEFYTKILPTID